MSERNVCLCKDTQISGIGYTSHYDATEALEGLVWTVFKLLRDEATRNDLGGSYDSLAATPAGAALIRQAMERDGD